MARIKLDISGTGDFISNQELSDMSLSISEQHRILMDGTGKGKEKLGWMHLPSGTDENLIARIEDIAKGLAGKAEIFVVIGIGGSYLGARAVIEALEKYFETGSGKKSPVMVYAGHQMDEDYMHDLMQLLDNKEYAVAVISKSGTTTEPAIAFRIIRNHLESKYGSREAARRIIAITDGSSGALRRLADEEGYELFVIPDDVGGRYSVLSPVGLLPIAVAGFDIRKLLKGAHTMQELTFSSGETAKNPAALYAAVRNILYRKGKSIEIMVNYLPRLHYFSEWWKQLYGESEGKEGKGIFPAGVGFTTDLHSMGQYIQEGRRAIFETVLRVEKTARTMEIPHDNDDPDGLNYLSGRRLHEVNRTAEVATSLAHIEGGVPVISLILPHLDEEVMGEMIYFFEAACALSGYELGVNPFDQPGVEAYKKNMFALLGKKGYEDLADDLKSKMD